MYTCALDGICQTATDSIHTISTSFVSLLLRVSSSLCAQSKGQPIKNANLNTDAVFTKLLLTFFDVEDDTFACLKEMQTPGGVYG